ncbi:NAD(+) diphosphatase [Streptacidiphilus jiangxiensis]|uniref:NAD(+) diphosphatase n=1 Tax=Streptacidiphilus jiangxiensis TaxID=235985 RepID=A0A1H7FVE4_STRJI|nr:NAD(+) diphosphatase [Streptacidiphilus jiangxiensis]SEK30043.1 NAD+ diphosphatase [Streptacidiphilus jiangxiensis]
MTVQEHFDRTLPLARAGVDRAAERRLDEPWLAAAWSHPSTRVLAVAEGKAFVADTEAGTELVLLSAFDAPAEGERIFLGCDEDATAYFAVLCAQLPGRLDGPERPAGLREVGGLLGARDAGLLVHATALENWHSANRFCPGCGHETAVAAAGHVRRCTSCAREHYPRTDGAVIMLVTDEQDRALLGRQALWPEGRYSTLAGFVEPGESLEQAVAREVSEETGVRVDLDSVRYVASQPWPFPASLMLGFTARIDSRPGAADIRVDGEELDEARWFSREDLAAGMAAGTTLPPSGISIARRLIELWYGQPLPEVSW